MLSQAEENYLKEIYALGEETEELLSTNSIAKKMRTKASSATDMLQKLAGKGLVDYTKYKGTRLSKEGEAKAMAIVRKHRLWETFLVAKLGFSWDEVHDIAEQLEHIQSKTLTNRLDAFLEYPSHDPHGHPIPNTNGKIVASEGIILADLKINEKGVLVGVKNATDSLLKYLNKINITIGDTIKVLDIEPFDDSVTIDNNAQQITISGNVAKNLYIKYR
ncbi:metal-dependent transcriptional regulator [Maribacter polysaccharolyticus]|uniref:metal-dependent transcriptional regulator n=1 Tax=Maribacter polysaccharolyticus TaxID=3020831 RepID=UPI00237FC246|nr:metal-dependent transcriptional regulator [Maribacter polysaccharolyticus]MDE3740463.1 metal-dependent transcriptional regulator [Maribacter polysaccharolyticus]